MIADFTAAGFHFGCACSTSADTPVICGVAIDVPLRSAAWLPLPTSVETMATPGAVMSGFSFASGERGPVDVNEAIPGTIGVPSVKVMAMPSRCASAKPSERGGGRKTLHAEERNGHRVLLAAYRDSR